MIEGLVGLIDGGRLGGERGRIMFVVVAVPYIGLVITALLILAVRPERTGARAPGTR